MATASQSTVEYAEALKPNSAATFCGQLHKQASAQGHNNNSNNHNNKAYAVHVAGRMS